MKKNLPILLLALSLGSFHACRGQQAANPALDYVKANYDKFEYRIPMRDGAHLFTSVYVPKDKSRTYPILLERTPYSVAPYGEDQYSANIASSELLVREGYIFAAQDVRGRFLSEGTFTWMAPHRPGKKPGETDESSDTYDTVEWLIKNVAGNNGNVGLWGGSYPGYYVMTGIVDAHPAVKAAIPSAPMVDLWKGDDVAHNGAFLMPHNLGFLARFGRPRPEPTTRSPPPKWEYWTPDGYEFYMDLATLPNVDKKYFHDEIIHWEEYQAHPVYDEFWQSRDISRHLGDVRPAVLTVGGWFDAQDLYGPLKAYATIEAENEGTYNGLVMGPWYHSAWMRGPGDRCAAIHWGSNTAGFYRERIELPFFNYYLKGEGSLDGIPEAMIFDTGRKEWKSYKNWPPRENEARRLYLHPDGTLAFSPPLPTGGDSFREYVSDPAKPVPYTQEITTRYGNDWMVEDQRFAARRPDVLVFQTGPLTEAVTLAGPIGVRLLASTSGTDADFVVKVIDVFPPDTPNPAEPNPANVRLGGYQMLLRGDPIRAKFRNSLSEPEPMVPNEPTPLEFELRDVHHTFLPGHRIMVQVQSSWFPMIDRNPHKFVDLFNDVQESDFQPATQRVFLGEEGSFLVLPVLRD